MLVAQSARPSLCGTSSAALGHSLWTTPIGGRNSPRARFKPCLLRAFQNLMRAAVQLKTFQTRASFAGELRPSLPRVRLLDGFRVAWSGDHGRSATVRSLSILAGATLKRS